MSGREIAVTANLLQISAFRTEGQISPETARLLQRRVRDARAGYMQSLDVLMAAKECGVYTKSSIMLGLGEKDEEIIDTMLDLKDAGKMSKS